VFSKYKNPSDYSVSFTGFDITQRVNCKDVFILKQGTSVLQLDLQV